MRSLSLVCLLGLALGGCAAPPPSPSAGGIVRTQVHRAASSVPGLDAVVMRVELAAGARAGRHTHPGDEIGYVLEGEGQLLVDGAAPRLLRAGDAFVVPAGVVHDAHNPGGAAMRLVGVFVVDKTKPLAAPAQ
ncbi:cupin domain-containing protein [Massilia violaceinigra]|uniref:Cupin domain-containing protein n=1 Tax=Massilia violaceinigra TaxID=2045208 RepID=A0ABY4AB06_9BURK|nr:cupin domain-containing protein [Massilia violaceinigra]UOD29768.1 cupin domain-containing protein [Massilia violaceinigra]